jgi:type II secretory pathway pseudopilin PulG
VKNNTNINFDSNSKGYILIEVLISVQILVVITIFIVTIAMYYSSVVYDNDNKQTAMYVLQTEIELYIAEQATKSKQYGNLIEESRSYYVNDNELDILIELVWKPIDSKLAGIKGTATWESKNKPNSMSFATNQYIQIFN